MQRNVYGLEFSMNTLQPVTSMWGNQDRKICVQNLFWRYWHWLRLLWNISHVNSNAIQQPSLIRSWYPICSWAGSLSWWHFGSTMWTCNGDRITSVVSYFQESWSRCSLFQTSLTFCVFRLERLVNVLRRKINGLGTKVEDAGDWRVSCVKSQNSGATGSCALDLCSVHVPVCRIVQKHISTSNRNKAGPDAVLQEDRVKPTPYPHLESRIPRAQKILNKTRRRTASQQAIPWLVYVQTHFDRPTCHRILDLVAAHFSETCSNLLFWRTTGLFFCNVHFGCQHFEYCPCCAHCSYTKTFVERRQQFVAVSLWLSVGNEAMDLVFQNQIVILCNLAIFRFHDQVCCWTVHFQAFVCWPFARQNCVRSNHSHARCSYLDFGCWISFTSQSCVLSLLFCAACHFICFKFCFHLSLFIRGTCAWHWHVCFAVLRRRDHWETFLSSQGTLGLPENSQGIFPTECFWYSVVAV